MKGNLNMADKRFIVRKGLVVNGEDEISEFNSKRGLNLPVGNDIDVGSGGDKPMLEDDGLRVGLTRFNEDLQDTESVVLIDGVLQWKVTGYTAEVQLTDPAYTAIENNTELINSNRLSSESADINLGDRIQANVDNIASNRVIIDKNVDDIQTLQLSSPQIPYRNCILSRGGGLSTEANSIPSHATDSVLLDEISVDHDMGVDFSSGWFIISKNMDVYNNWSIKSRIMGLSTDMSSSFDSVLKNDIRGIVDVRDTSISIATKTKPRQSIPFQGVRSVVFDFKDNWGNASYMGIRSIEFYWDGRLVDIGTFVSYSSSTSGVGSSPDHAFNQALPKTGAAENNSWYTTSNITSESRLTIIFDELIDFDDIIINNYHDSGIGQMAGVKNTAINISMDPVSEAIASSYNAVIPDGFKIFDGVIRTHKNYGDIGYGVGDIPDDMSCLMGQPISAKTVVIDIDDNHGYVGNVGMRSFEFLMDGKVIPLMPADYEVDVSSEVSDREAINLFDVSRSKTGNDFGNEWQSEFGVVGNIRIVLRLYDEIKFNEIHINNAHAYGNGTDKGAKSIKIQVSSSSVVDTVYGNTVVNSYSIFQGDIRQHVIANTDDNQSYGSITGVKSEKIATFVIDIFSNWGGSSNGIRSIELLDSSGGVIDVTDQYVWSSSVTSASYDPLNAFNPRSKVGLAADNSWLGMNRSSIPDKGDRIYCVVRDGGIDAGIDVYGIRINNYHNNGADVSMGIKNIKIWISPDSIIPNEFNDSTGLQLYWSGEIPQHRMTDSVDDFSIFPKYSEYYVPDEIANFGDDISVTSWSCTNEWVPLYQNVRSVIFDITDNWGNLSYFGIRSIEFIGADGKAIDMDGNYTSYVNSDNTADNIFNTTLNKSGLYTNNQWLGIWPGPYRIVIIFDTPQNFRDIRINNSHNNGTDTDMGIKTTKITTSPSFVNSIVYDEVIIDGTVIYDGEILKHVIYNTPDDRYYCSKLGYNTVVAKSIMIDIENNWGYNQLGLRSIEFIDENDNIIPLVEGNFVAFSSSTDDAYDINDVFDINNNKINGMVGNAWLSQSGVTSNVRLTIVNDLPIRFKGIKINNIHNGIDGTYLDAGIKNIKIYTCIDRIIDNQSITYGDIDRFDYYWGGEIPKHTAVDQADDYTISEPIKWEINPGTGFTQNKFMGDGEVRSIEHPMKKNPCLLMFKDLDDNSSPWQIYSDKLSPMEALKFSDNIPESHNAFWNGTSPTDKVINIGSDVGVSRVNRLGNMNFMAGWFGDDLSHISDGMTGIEGSTAFISSEDINKIVYSNVKSVIFDIADNWTDSNTGVRSIEFFFGGQLLNMTPNDMYTAYGNSINDEQLPMYAFDTSLSKTGDMAYTSWLGVGQTNHRLIIVFKDPQTFDELVINNFISDGGSDGMGIKNVVITTSTNEITDITYDADISNASVIFDDVISKHPAINVVDDQSYCSELYAFNAGFIPETIIMKSISSVGHWIISKSDDKFMTSLHMGAVSDLSNFRFISSNGYIVSLPSETQINIDKDQNDYWLICAFASNGEIPSGSSVKVKATTDEPFVSTIGLGWNYKSGAYNTVAGFNQDTTFMFPDIDDGDHDIFINKDNTITYDTGDLKIAGIDVVDGIIINIDEMPEGNEYESGWFPVSVNTTYTIPNRFGEATAEVEIWWNSIESDVGRRRVGFDLIEESGVYRGVGAVSELDASEIRIGTGDYKTYRSTNNPLSQDSTNGFYKIQIKRGY